MRRLSSLGCGVLLVTAVVALSPERASTHGAITTTVLFDREIVRVLNDHCVMCHAEQGPAFPLETYEQTWARGQAIRTSVLRRHMPPWAAVPGYGTFANANNLTLRESQFVTAWVEGLGPRNAGKVFLNVANATGPAEQVRAAPHAHHWLAGEPDLKVPLRQNVTGRSTESVVSTTVDLGLTGARRVDSIEYLPGDRRALRAAVFTLEQTGQWLGSWTPWYGFVQAPMGAAFRLPARARVVAQLHYGGTPEAVVESGTLGLSFAPAGATRPISDLTLRASAPANGGGRRRARLRLAASTSVWAVVPEVTTGLASVQVTARTPDGGTNVLLLAKDPPAEWPTPYILARPVSLPSGTELTVSARFNGPPPTTPFTVTVSAFTSPTQGR